MNVYGVIILIGLLVDYVLHTASDVLNLKALAGRVPDSVATLYGQDELVRARNYIREVTATAICERSVVLLLVLAFWFLGGFGWLDVVVRPWFASELARGLAYIGLLALAYSLVGIPFQIHDTFTTEARFGFNRTTWRTFVSDRIKGLMLAALIGGLLLSGILLLFLRAGDMAWLLCWVIVVVFSFTFQWLAPALILPLFNRFEPMPQGGLRDAIIGYAEALRFPLQNVYLIDGSRRSSKANAFFTGLGRRRRIALFDTLVQRHTTDEVVAVLAHEVGHYRLKHVTKGLAFGALHAGIALFMLDFFLGQPGLYDALLFDRQSLHAGFVCFGLLYTPVETFLSILSNLVSRRHEFAADRFAIDTAPSPDSLPGALKTLSVSSLSHPNPHWFHVFLNYSHPSLAQRLRAIDEHLAERKTA
jgi:STE24 endopeptidase